MVTPERMTTRTATRFMRTRLMATQPGGELLSKKVGEVTGDGGKKNVTERIQRHNLGGGSSKKVEGRV